MPTNISGSNKNTQIWQKHADPTNKRIHIISDLITRIQLNYSDLTWAQISDRNTRIRPKYPNATKIPISEAYLDFTKRNRIQHCTLIRPPYPNLTLSRMCYEKTQIWSRFEHAQYPATQLWGQSNLHSLGEVWAVGRADPGGARRGGQGEGKAKDVHGLVGPLFSNPVISIGAGRGGEEESKEVR